MLSMAAERDGMDGWRGQAIIFFSRDASYLIRIRRRVSWRERSDRFLFDSIFAHSSTSTCVGSTMNEGSVVEMGTQDSSLVSLSDVTACECN